MNEFSHYDDKLVANPPATCKIGKHPPAPKKVRPCLSKPSYRAPKWALMVRLMQKERLKSPHKSLIIETRPFWSFGPFWPKLPFSIFGHFGQPFRARVDTPKKSPTWGFA